MDEVRQLIQPLDRRAVALIGRARVVGHDCSSTLKDSGGPYDGPPHRLFDTRSVWRAVARGTWRSDTN